MYKLYSKPLALFILIACFSLPTHKASAGGLDDTYIPAFQAMTEQMTITMLHQAQLIGMMMDAKTQLKTQQTLQKMMARANKDYLPSEALCTFGTGTRSLAQSEYGADIKKVQIVDFMRDRQTQKEGTASGEASVGDIKNRFKAFQKLYCDPSDLKGSLGVNGKYNICNTAGNENILNADIDYTRTISAAPDFALDLANGTSTGKESAVFALGSNLYNATGDLFAGLDPTKLPNNSTIDSSPTNFMSRRDIAAMRSIAQNTYASQVALKDRGSANAAVKPFMEAAFKGLGVTDPKELGNFLGKNGEGPSYDTQMNYLTKTIYQNPNFYIGLIDKPANIDRQRGSMEAFGLMQKRDIADVLYRREMLLSALIEVRLRNNPNISRPVVDGGATATGAIGAGQ